MKKYSHATHLRRFAICCGLWLFVSGCELIGSNSAGLPPFPDRTDPIVDLLDTTWQLIGLADGDDYRRVDSKINAYVKFSTERTERSGYSGHVNGKGGCNSFGGSFRLRNDHLEVYDSYMTLMACEENRMAVEASFMNILSGTSRVRIHRSELRIYGENDQAAVLTTRSGE